MTNSSYRDPRPLTRAILAWWNRAVASEVGTYPTALLTAEETGRIWANHCEVAKECRNVFLVYVTASAYAVAALAGVRDANFFTFATPAVKLPLLGVDLAPAAFFLAMPLLVVLVGMYLQLYVGELRRLQRRLARKTDTVDLIAKAHDIDLWYPWITTFSQHTGLFGSLSRLAANLLIWAAAPTVVALYYFRLIPLRSGVHAWRSGPGLPPSQVVGVLAIVAIVAQCVWSAARRSVDAEFRLGHPLSNADVGWRLVLVGGVTVLLALQPTWAHLGPTLDLRYTELTRPSPSKDERPTGIALAGADLRRADLEGAVLEYGDLRGADLRGANLSFARLAHADLSGANLADARLDHARLDGAVVRSLPTPGKNGAAVRTSFRGASLEQASLASAVIEKADFAGANLRYAVLDGATVSDRSDFTCIDGWGSRWRGASVTDAILVGADLKDARMEGALLSDCRCEGARFTRARLQGAFLWGTHFEAAEFTAAHLDSATFETAPLHGAFAADGQAPSARAADFADAPVVARPLPLEGEPAAPACGSQLIATENGIEQKPTRDIIAERSNRPADLKVDAGQLCNGETDSCISARTEALRAAANECIRAGSEAPHFEEGDCGVLARLLSAPPSHRTWNPDPKFKPVGAPP